MAVPKTSIISVLICLSLFIVGLNIFEGDSQSDLAGVLFLAWIVLMLDKFRIYLRVFNRRWIFPIAVAVYYLFSQVVVFFMWDPIWFRIENIMHWVFSTRLVYTIYYKFPTIVVFMRRQSLAFFKLVMMLLVFYKTLKSYRVPEERKRYRRGIHKEALRGLLSKSGNRTPRVSNRRKKKQ